MSIWSELKRRSVFKVGAAYAIVAWLLIQVASILLPTFDAPGWVMPVFATVVILGFPLALVIAWAFELTPEGIKLTAGVAPATGAAKTSGRKLDYVVISLLVLALAFVIVDNYMLDPGVEVLPNSVAVLPFENLSPDPDNAYFALGMHDTILHELAKIRDITVIARTSVLPYAGGTVPIARIADELNVQTVMEGTVQYADDQVRITAQLIEPSTGAHLWSGNYDRPAARVFEIQSDIAAQIAAALEAELSLGEQRSLAALPTESAEAYRLYLRALALFSEGDADLPSGSTATRARMQDYLDAAIELDPDFALAHAWKAWTYQLSIQFDPVRPTEWIQHRAEHERLTREHAERALDLDSRVGIAHMALAWAEFHNWNGDEAWAASERAVEASPSDAEVLQRHATLEPYLSAGGTGVRWIDRALEIDPSNAEIHRLASHILLISGETDRAAAEANACLDREPNNPACLIQLAAIDVARNDVESAASALSAAERQLGNAASPAMWANLAYGYGRAGLPADANRMIDRLESIAVDRYVDPAAWALAFFGASDEDRAREQFDLALDNVELVQDPWPIHFLTNNLWSDASVRQRELAAVRERLSGFR